MARKDALLKLSRILVKRRDALRQALIDGNSPLADMGDDVDGDVMDQALDTAHEEISSQLVEAESRELAQIEDALERLHAGKYGLCGACGSAIKLARLKALPYAKLCIDCQREEERGGGSGAHDYDWGRVQDLDSSERDLTINDVEMDVS